MKGIAASQGIAIGRAFIKTSGIKLEKTFVENTEEEIRRFYAALERSKTQLQEIKEITTDKIGAEEAQIFEAHAMILKDPVLLDGTIDKIRNHSFHSSWAVRETVEEIAQLFKNIEDEYIKERLLDLQDVSARLIENILGIRSFDYSSIAGPAIIVADELTPSDMSRLSLDKALGIITEAGGVTSHTAIMSRVMGLPAIVGVENLLKQVKDRDLVIMDGSTGELFIAPDEETVQKYERKIAEQLEEKDALKQYIGEKTTSSDGFEISIGCNIGSPQDLEAVLRNDGEGIGLFRSEFLYMNRSSMPSEEEQFAAYKAVAEGMEGKPVIIRTLDIGGDKQLSYMDFPKEENPFLGYRAIRYCLEEKEVFRIQLRAMLRASAYGNVKIMLPMVCSVEEVLAAKAELHKAMEELQQRGIDYNPNIELGIMIETPAAAIISDKLAEQVDFFSIGTNDLTQYTLAVDRMNSKISKLYTTYHPAVLSLIKLIIDNANKAGIWVGMCGEAAQDEILVPVFLGFGIHELSVSPPQVLRIRKLISKLNKQDMEHHAKAALMLPTSEQVKDYLNLIK